MDAPRAVTVGAVPLFDLALIMDPALHRAATVTDRASRSFLHRSYTLPNASPILIPRRKREWAVW